VKVASCSSVVSRIESPSRASSGRYFATGSSSDISPAFTARPSRAAVSTFVTEPIEKSVSA